MHRGINKRGLLLLLSSLMLCNVLMSSSHREAPLIADDPLADNTDVYAFRSPDQPDKICIIANYIPGQLPFGGPIIIILEKTSVTKSTLIIILTHRGMTLFTALHLSDTNEDPTTFFNIRLGKKNLEEHIHYGKKHRWW